MKFINLISIVGAFVVNVSQTEATTAAPVSPAPSPLSLTYSRVGLGECTDANGAWYSRIDLSNVAGTVAQCANECYTVFPKANLVGFGRSDHCACYFTGGALPAWTPPRDGYRTWQVANPGMGAVFGSKNSTNVVTWECFAYAQGTGSPTTPGATHSPVSPAPTGTATHAPTTGGVVNYRQVGPGTCVDATGTFYQTLSHLEPSGPTVAYCANYCRSQFSTTHLLGFSPQDYACSCFYSRHNLPSFPAGIDSLQVIADFRGDGPIAAGVANPGYNGCYTFDQGTFAPTKVPTKAPTKAPTTSAPITSTKAPVSQAPVTKAPVTKAPVTKAPVTKAPVTKAPVTKAPTTPATHSPSTGSKGAKGTKSTKTGGGTKSSKRML